MQSWKNWILILTKNSANQIYSNKLGIDNNTNEKKKKIYIYIYIYWIASPKKNIQLLSKNLPQNHYSQSRETVDLEEKPGSKARSGAKEPKG